MLMLSMYDVWRTAGAMVEPSEAPVAHTKEGRPFPAYEIQALYRRPANEGWVLESITLMGRLGLSAQRGSCRYSINPTCRMIGDHPMEDAPEWARQFAANHHPDPVQGA